MIQSTPITMPVMTGAIASTAPMMPAARTRSAVSSSSQSWMVM